MFHISQHGKLTAIHNIFRDDIKRGLHHEPKRIAATTTQQMQLFDCFVDFDFSCVVNATGNFLVGNKLVYNKLNVQRILNKKYEVWHSKKKMEEINFFNFIKKYKGLKNYRLVHRWLDGNTSLIAKSEDFKSNHFEQFFYFE